MYVSQFLEHKSAVGDNACPSGHTNFVSQLIKRDGNYMKFSMEIRSSAQVAESNDHEAIPENILNLD